MSPVTEELWSRHTDVIRKFVEARPRQEQLASEVAYTIEKRLREGGIEFSSVAFRAKTLESFLRKIARKRYDNPLADITDLSGVRIVYLYASDLPAIRDILSREFRVIVTVDKLGEHGEDRFGYGAIHFVVQLSRRSSGARYDDLRPLKCEVQVRTALQDAWAIISHHLIYKREEDVPLALRRKINSLAGLLETADDQFDSLRVERETYVKTIEDQLAKRTPVREQEINVDTVAALLRSVFPDTPTEGSDGHISILLSSLNKKRYRDLGDLANLLERTTKARELYFEFSREILAAAGILAVAIALDDPSFREEGWDYRALEHIRAAEDLVEKRK